MFVLETPTHMNICIQRIVQLKPFDLSHLQPAVEQHELLLFLEVLLHGLGKKETHPAEETENTDSHLISQTFKFKHVKRVS